MTEWWKRQQHPSVALRVLIKHHVASCGGQILDTISLFDKLFDLNGTGDYPQVEGTVIPDKEVEAVAKELVGNTDKPTKVVEKPVQVVEKEVPHEVVQEEVKPEVEPVVEMIEMKQPEQEPEVHDLDMDAIFGH